MKSENPDFFDILERKKFPPYGEISDFLEFFHRFQNSAGTTCWLTINCKSGTLMSNPSFGCYGVTFGHISVPLSSSKSRNSSKNVEISTLEDHIDLRKIVFFFKNGVAMHTALYFLSLLSKITLNSWVSGIFGRLQHTFGIVRAEFWISGIVRAEFWILWKNSKKSLISPYMAGIFFLKNIKKIGISPTSRADTNFSRGPTCQ